MLVHVQFEHWSKPETKIKHNRLDIGELVRTISFWKYFLGRIVLTNNIKQITNSTYNIRITIHKRIIADMDIECCKFLKLFSCLDVIISKNTRFWTHILVNKKLFFYAFYMKISFKDYHKTLLIICLVYHTLLNCFNKNI